MWEDFTRRATALLKSPAALRASTVQFFLQAVLGTWPMEGEPDAAYTERLARYMQKASREAAVDTTWAWPDTVYETALDRFVRVAFDNPGFLLAAARMMHFIAPAGAINSLSALTLRILSAGIPDIYQGSESWLFSLVDPDNRGLVDFDALGKKLHANGAGPQKEWRDGGMKIWLTRELLKIRRGFLRATGGDYGIRDLPVTGAMAECIVALLLSGADRRLAVIVPRYPGRILEGVGDIDMATARWRDTQIQLPRAEKPVNLLTGRLLASGPVTPRELFSDFPVAVLGL
jgi:(1->4)-alpha-D-glucan 1-alpha-D-glucosylmutase